MENLCYPLTHACFSVQLPTALLMEGKIQSLFKLSFCSKLAWWTQWCSSVLLVDVKCMQRALHLDVLCLLCSLLPGDSIVQDLKLQNMVYGRHHLHNIVKKTWKTGCLRRSGASKTSHRKHLVFSQTFKWVQGQKEKTVVCNTDDGQAPHNDVPPRYKNAAGDR